MQGSIEICLVIFNTSKYKFKKSPPIMDDLTNNITLIICMNYSNDENIILVLDYNYIIRIDTSQRMFSMSTALTPFIVLIYNETA